ncbi:CBS domain-containing protein [Paraburkholderia phenazinium]|uniref:CBS domain-containing protein n=1 Tax=Paraburkholderia phenazinium TaxID=60549 RepID=A0A1G8BD14_9BURK|nr:CBS domain-containing protein [Paraburkholderia phenazinium]SDH31115.1 CBS domain-containing protein [Paraburkholderia phenazinium]
MNTGTICTRNVITCQVGTSALDAAKLMRNHHVGDLVVVTDASPGHGPVGVITDRDIVVSVLACELDAGTLCVSDIMSSPAITAFDWEDAWHVLRRMRMNGVRRMPVISDTDELIGIVTLDDLVGAVSELLSELSCVSQRQRHFEEKART